MKVLALAINFQGFTYETVYHEQCALKEKIEAAGGKFILYGPGYDYPTNDVQSYVDRLTSSGNRPDLIISYLSESLFFNPLSGDICEKYGLENEFKEFPRGLEKVSGIPKVMWINDFWHMTPEQWDWTLLDHGFSDVIATYCPPFLRESHFRETYSQRVREQVRFHPLSRGITPLLFKDYGESRDLDVTLLGARNSFYPLREYFHHTLENQTWFSYFSKPHPGYRFDQPATLSGEAYARVLARSRIFVSCTGRYSLPFIKIFEVLASGALLMCDRPTGASLIGLVDGETYVEVDQVNFLEKLRHYLGNEQERARIAAAGRQLFLERHTTGENAERMFGILAGIAERGPHPHPVPPLEGEGTLRDAAAHSSPHPTATEAAAKRAAFGVRDLLSRYVGALRQSPVPAELPEVTVASPWEAVKGGSCLDWARVVEVRHALEICRLDTLRELGVVEKFGLNAHWSKAPVLTHHPETISLRPKILKLLAAALRARVLGEVGTARGLQSIFWADYLREEKVEDPVVATCDITGHDDPVYRTPLTGDALWSRRELWEQEPAAALIDFVHGESPALASMLDAELDGRRIDLLYIDGRHDEEGAYRDYSNLSRHLSDSSVLVFDDCDPRFPGVERAVNRVAAERDCELRLISFWPAPYTVALLNSKIPLTELVQR